MTSKSIKKDSLKTSDNYNELLKAIKETKCDEYKPKKYNFNLNNFDKKGKIKK